MEGEICSLGGEEWRRDLMVDQRRLGFLEASLMDSILDSGRDLFISLYVEEHRSAVNEAVGFSIGSLPTTLEPPSPLLGFNRIR